MLLRVRPTRALKIKDDKGIVIPMEGALVTKSVRIARIIRDGDLAVISEQKEKKGKK